MSKKAECQRCGVEANEWDFHSYNRLDGDIWEATCHGCHRKERHAQYMRQWRKDQNSEASEREKESRSARWAAIKRLIENHQLEFEQLLEEEMQR